MDGQCEITYINSPDLTVQDLMNADMKAFRRHALHYVANPNVIRFAFEWDQELYLCVCCICVCVCVCVRERGGRERESERARERIREGRW